MLVRMWRKGKPCALWINWWSHCGKYYRDFPKKLEKRATVWSSSSTSGCLCEENKTLTRKDTCTTIFIAGLFTISNRWKQSTCLSTDKWNVVHTMKYYSVIKRNEVLIHYITWVNLECVLVSEFSQTEDKYCNSIYMKYLE